MKSTHHKQLLELHKNGEWICSTTIEYMRDHRKRYSELMAKGFLFNSMPCDGRCGNKHNARIFMRKLNGTPTKLVSKVIEKDGKYYETKVQVPLF